MLDSVTDDSGEYPLDENGRGVLYFWADWCQPCKAFAPVYEQLWQQFGGNVPIKKIDATTVNTGVLTSLNIRSIPTIVMFRNYEPVLTLHGTKTITELIDSVDQVFND